MRRKKIICPKCTYPADSKLVVDETETIYFHGGGEKICYVNSTVKCPKCGKPANKKIQTGEAEFTYAHGAGIGFCVVSVSTKKD